MAEEIMLRRIQESNEETQLFRLFFLKDDKEKSVEIIEVKEIDFTEILQHLERGESVFIAPKRKQESDSSEVAKKVSKKDAEEPWYFTRI